MIRGEDHISNTPRQILLYQALGFTPPEFAHLSLVLGPGSHAALEAARRDVGRGVPRARLSARGAGELPRADRLVAAHRRRQRRERCRAAAGRRDGAAVRDRGRRAQRRRLRSREARVDEPPLHEGGGAGAARGRVAALLHGARLRHAAQRRGDGVRLARSCRWRSARSIGSRRFPIACRFLFDFDAAAALATPEVAEVLDAAGRARGGRGARRGVARRRAARSRGVPRGGRRASSSEPGRRGGRCSIRSAWR